MSNPERVSLDRLALSVLDSLSEGCQVVDINWRYLYVNRTAAAQARISHELLLGRTMHECYPDIEHTQMFELLRLSMSDRRHRRIDNEVVFPDGSSAWFELRFFPVPEGMCIFSVDITARKRAERSLHDSEHRFNAFMDSLPTAAWMRDEHGRFVYVNKAWERTVGHTREQALGRTASELLPPEVARSAEEDDARLLGTGEDFRVILQTSAFGGHERWFQLTNFLFLDAAGARFSGGLGLEITAQKQLEEGLRRAEESLRLLIDGVQDYGILMLDPRGLVATWNNGAQRLLGYAADEIVGEDFRRFYPPEDLAAGAPSAELDTARARGRSAREGWCIRKDGTRFWADTIITPLHHPVGRHFGFATIIRDLTTPRRLEQQLRQAQKMDAIGSLAGGIAHDFNNILSVILSYSQLIVEGLQPDEPMRADLEEIRAAGHRAAELTRQLLAFGRKQLLKPRPMNLNDILAGIGRMLRRLVGADVELTFLLAPDLGPASVDPGQIEQVVVNLIVNARDAMPRGGKLMIETENVELNEAYAAEHEGASPGPYVVLTVSDTGTGMDEATRARIFEPFFTTKERGKGTGLGLPTVFGIVHQSGGHIRLDSEPGAGSTFKLYFPRTGEATDGVSGTQSPTHASRGTETILLVEDDERVRAVAANILRRHGYHVLEAQSGGDALLLCEQHGATIHLMLTDVVMPRMTGRQLAERLKPVRPTMKVLYMSGYTDNSIVHHGVLDSDVAFLQKPFTPDKLTIKVREVLDTPAAP